MVAVLTGLPLLVGLAEAVRHAWICDDIFISFRYIDHLLSGQGLVFNSGERVEGYTHFLWVIVLAALSRLGIDLVWLGRYLPLVAFVPILGLLFRRTLQCRPTGWLGLPIAAWCIALHRDMQIFASSGLETAPFALLLLLGVLVTARERPRFELGAALYAVATLVRPEGAMYAATAGAYVLWRTRRVRPALFFAGIWVALVLPFLLFRLEYYGALLPNTYYAKSAGAAYWSQGWRYTWLYFGTYAVLLACLAAIPASWVLRLRRGEDTEPRRASNLDVPVLAGVQVLLTVIYVTRLGGDFMFARFYVPVTPLLYLVAEEVLRWVRWRWVEVAAAVILVGGTLAARAPRHHTFRGRDPVHGVVDEANYYTAEVVDHMRAQGTILGQCLQGTRARVGLLSGQDAVAYFGKLPYALEPHGLTDAELARMPLAARGRPGHERTVSYEQLLRRHIHFRLLYAWSVGLSHYQQIRFGEFYGQLLFYDRELMEQLRGRPGINFIDFPQYLDQYVDNLDPARSPNLVNDYFEFQLFYFVHNDDPARLARVRQAFLDAGVPETRLQEAERIAGQLRVASAGQPQGQLGAR
jgi:hypothetical protein